MRLCVLKDWNKKLLSSSVAYPNGVVKKEIEFDEIKEEIEGEFENILEKLPEGTAPNESVGKI